MVKLIDTAAQVRNGTGYWAGRAPRKGDAAKFAKYAASMAEGRDGGSADNRALWAMLAKAGTQTSFDIAHHIAHETPGERRKPAPKATAPKATAPKIAPKLAEATAAAAPEAIRAAAVGFGATPEQAATIVALRNALTGTTPKRRRPKATAPAAPKVAALAATAPAKVTARAPRTRKAEPRPRKRVNILTPHRARLAEPIETGYRLIDLTGSDWHQIHRNPHAAVFYAS